MSLLILVAILVALIGLAGAVYRRTAKVEGVVNVVQSFLTAVAILLAGFWYFVERKGTSHADLQLRVEGAHLTDELALLEVHLAVRNSGTTLLKADQWKVQLLSVDPATLPLAAALALPGDSWPERVGDAQLYSGGELLWPALRRFNGFEIHDVEPGETDIKTFDFLVACKDEKLLKVMASLRKADFKWDPTAVRLGRDTRATPREFWWKARALVDGGKVCAAPVGSTVKLSGNEE
jgi:hypothetical protein